MLTEVLATPAIPTGVLGCLTLSYNFSSLIKFIKEYTFSTNEIYCKVYSRVDLIKLNLVLRMLLIVFTNLAKLEQIWLVTNSKLLTP